jgi:hypothetical protein
MRDDKFMRSFFQNANEEKSGRVHLPDWHPEATSTKVNSPIRKNESANLGFMITTVFGRLEKPNWIVSLSLIKHSAGSATTELSEFS